MGIASLARQISGGISKNSSVKSRMNQDQERQLRRSLELFDDDGSGALYSLTQSLFFTLTHKISTHNH